MFALFTVGITKENNVNILPSTSKTTILFRAVTKGRAKEIEQNKSIIWNTLREKEEHFWTYLRRYSSSEVWTSESDWKNLIRRNLYPDAYRNAPIRKCSQTSALFIVSACFWRLYSEKCKTGKAFYIHSCFRYFSQF